MSKSKNDSKVKFLKSRLQFYQRWLVISSLWLSFFSLSFLMTCSITIDLRSCLEWLLQNCKRRKSMMKQLAQHAIVRSLDRVRTSSFSFVINLTNNWSTICDYCFCQSLLLKVSLKFVNERNSRLVYCKSTFHVQMHTRWDSILFERLSDNNFISYFIMWLFWLNDSQVTRLCSLINRELIRDLIS